MLLVLIVWGSCWWRRRVYYGYGPGYGAGYGYRAPYVFFCLCLHVHTCSSLVQLNAGSLSEVLALGIAVAGGAVRCELLFKHTVILAYFCISLLPIIRASMSTELGAIFCHSLLCLV